MKFTAACLCFIAAVSAQDYGYNSYQPYDDSRHGRGDSYGRHGDFGDFDGHRGSVHGGYGSGHHGDSYGQRTYGHVKKIGYGIYNFDRSKKPLRANDGYLVKQRTDPYNRNYADVYAKCILDDPNEEGYASGLLYLAQAPKSDKTKIWGQISGAGYADLSINALGDQREGCDSTGAVFNPYVSASGYGYGKEPHTAPGALGPVGDGKIEIWADVDLSGTHSIIGRSMVVTIPEQKHDYHVIPEQRVACCTIGLAAGPNSYQPAQKHGYGHGDSYGHDSYGHDDHRGHGDSYGHDNGYGYGNQGYGNQGYY